MRIKPIYRYKRLFEIPECPECETKTLYIEHSDAEYSIDSWVACEECDYTDDVRDEHMPLSTWFGYGEHEKHWRRNSKTRRKRRQMVRKG